MNDLSAVFTQEEMDALLAHERQLVASGQPREVRHPLLRVTQSLEHDAQVAANTNRALRLAYRLAPDWVTSLKSRLLEVSAYSESESALAEIRALGAMAEAGFALAIPSGEQSRPEFLVHHGADVVRVEVHSKHMNETEAEQLRRFRANSSPGIRECVVTPFGSPAVGPPAGSKHESVTENAIQKIAQIKQSESQLSDTEPSVLWLDFQGEIWQLAMNADSAAPLGTWQGDFTSGALWYALYGWKGAPIFESFPAELRQADRPRPMGHDGRFRRRTKVDCVVATFPRDTILFENPWSTKLPPAWFWESALLLPWLGFESCWINWPENQLLRRIEMEQARLEALERWASHRP